MEVDIFVAITSLLFKAVSSQDEDMGQFDMQDPLEESTASLVSSSTSAYSSFPVDVVVYVRVQVRVEANINGVHILVKPSVKLIYVV